MIKPTRQPLHRGDKIGVFEVESVLVSDPIGYCYQAFNHHLNERVALTEYFPDKLAIRDADSNAVLPASENRRDEYNEGLTAFIDRAEAFSQVQHDNVLRIHNVLRFNDTAYCVAELVSDRSIAIADSYSETLLAEMFADLVSALEQIHEKGIVHGAVSPESIIFRDGRTVLLTGIYSSFGTGHQSATNRARVNSAYVDTSSDKGRETVGPETDLYGLAATIYACLTHQKPVPMRTRLSAVNNDQADPLPAISSSNEEHDRPAWVGLIDRMLSIAKQDRFTAASEVLVEMNRLQNEAGPNTGLAVAKAEESNRRYRYLPYAAVIAVIALFLSVAIGPLRKGQDDTGPTIAVKAPGANARFDNSKTSNSYSTDWDKRKAASFAALESGVKRDSESSKLQNYISGGQVKMKSTPVAETDRNAADLTKRKMTESIGDEDDSVTAKLDEQPVTSGDVQTDIVAKVNNNPGPSNPIQSHLDAAKNDFKALRLTTPEGNNAYEHYAAVLSLDPQNQEALEGNQRIVDVYVWLIGNAIQKGERKLAGIYLARADKIATHNPSLESLRQDLSSIEN